MTRMWRRRVSQFNGERGEYSQRLARSSTSRTRRKLVADRAAADLPDVRPTHPSAQLDVVDEGIVDIAREHHEVLRRLRVAEDVEDRVRGARMRHPVLGIHQQRVTEPGEDPLYGLDQLDPEDRRRRNEQHGGLPPQGLLQIGQGLPVH